MFFRILSRLRVKKTSTFGAFSRKREKSKNKREILLFLLLFFVAVGLLQLGEGLVYGEAEANQDGSVDPRHWLWGKLADALFKPPFVERANLLEQNNAVFG